ncbi:MAG: glycosyltransferase [Candidatus Omnitrophica bacterium]|nr:glycosyltransferase [Candidatus Omnitrophota bacterium]
MNKGAYVSIVVPVFNEEDGLRELYSELSSVLKGIGKSYEIIFVDDGSKDKSLEILEGFKNTGQNVKIISFCRNFGQHAAVMAGFNSSEGEVVVTLDADLQNPPGEIPKLLEKIEEGFDVVAGRRMGRKEGILRKFSSAVMNIIISKLTGVKLKDYGCMLRAYKRSIINYLLQYGEKCVYIPAFASWLTGSVIEVPVKDNPRKYGKSKYNLLSFLRQAFDLITAYTLVPIQLISIVGAVFLIISVLLTGYLLSFRFFFGTPSPLTTFVAILLFLSGVTTFFIGVVSEYLVRMSIETRKRPLYIIKEKFERKNGDK